MVHIRLEDILSESDASARISQIFNEVENDQRTIVVTKDGRPAVAITPISNLEAEVTTEESTSSINNTSTPEVSEQVTPIIEPLITPIAEALEPVANTSTVDTNSENGDELPPLPDMPS